MLVGIIAPSTATAHVVTSPTTATTVTTSTLSTAAVSLPWARQSNATVAERKKGYPGGTMLHMDPDEGFDDPWSIYCDNGNVFRLAEGQYSKFAYCADVNHFSVLADNALLCDDGGIGANRRYYYGGVHAIGNYADKRCWHQRA